MKLKYMDVNWLALYHRARKLYLNLDQVVSDTTVHDVFNINILSLINNSWEQYNTSEWDDKQL